MEWRQFDAWGGAVDRADSGQNYTDAENYRWPSWRRTPPAPGPAHAGTQYLLSGESADEVIATMQQVLELGPATPATIGKICA
jgi:hypothetical protein